MSTGDEKIAANQLNAKKSTGPRNTTSTRFNATKHGLLAAGVTELDDAEGYRATLRDLKQEKDPVGAMEVFLVESAALDMTRWRRARHLEAEYITAILNPPIRAADPIGDFDKAFKGAIIDPGLPAPMPCESVQALVRIFQRYESTFALRLFRTLHELERLQRMRRGERLPAPTTVDVNVHASSTQSVDSFTESPDKQAVKG